MITALLSLQWWLVFLEQKRFLQSCFLQLLLLPRLPGVQMASWEPDGFSFAVCTFLAGEGRCVPSGIGWLNAGRADVEGTIFYQPLCLYLLLMGHQSALVGVEQQNVQQWLNLKFYSCHFFSRRLYYLGTYIWI